MEKVTLVGLLTYSGPGGDPVFTGFLKDEIGIVPCVDCSYDEIVSTYSELMPLIPQYSFSLEHVFCESSAQLVREAQK